MGSIKRGCYERMYERVCGGWLAQQRACCYERVGGYEGMR